MNKRDAQLCDSLTTQSVLKYFFVTVFYLQANRTIYSAQRLDLVEIDGSNVNKLPKRVRVLSSECTEIKGKQGTGKPLHQQLLP